jgi:hypothetical protein
VRNDITALVMKPGDGVMKMGTPVQLNLFAQNRSGGLDLIPGTTAAWSSDDVGVGEVNRQGRLTPRAPGLVTITAAYASRSVTAVFMIID